MARKISFFLAVITIMACNRPADIYVKYAGQRIKVSGVDQTTLGGLRRDTLSKEAWNNLLPVRRMPADTDTKDDVPPMAGKYHVSDTEISFQPDTPFRKGETYFARYYRYDKKINWWDLILHRRKLAQAEYTEVVFKP